MKTAAVSRCPVCRVCVERTHAQTVSWHRDFMGKPCCASGQPWRITNEEI